MALRCIGYCRVSTDGQGEHGYGLEAQRTTIDAEAKHRGWQLLEHYVDVASGGSLKRRQRLQDALTLLERREADVLMVAKLDRLSRSLLDFAGIMRLGQEQGWSIVALDIGVDTSTVNGELIANIIMALAQWERRVIGQRTKDALSVVRARGTRLGRPANTDVHTIQKIHMLRGAGLSYGKVAAALNREGVPTAQGGREWYPSTVQAVERRHAA